MQFLLGVDAPVSLLLVRQILLPIVLDTLLALPVYALVRRWLLAVPARGPAPPPAPRLHDRRAQPALARLSLMPPNLEERRPPITPQLALRVAVLGGIALRAVRDRLLPPLVPAGAVRRRVRRPGAREPRAQDRDRGAARRHRRPQRQPARAHARRAGRPDRAERAARGRARGRRRLPPGAQRLRAAPPGRRRPAALARAPAPRGGAPLHEGRAPRAPPPGPRRAPRRARRRPAAAGRRASCAARSAASAACSTCRRARSSGASSRASPRRPTRRDDQDRRPALGLQLPQGAQGRLPRRRRSRSSTCARTRTRSSPRSCSARWARSRRTSSSRSSYRGVERARASARTASRRPTTATCAATTATRASSVDALGNRDDRREVTRREPPAGPAARAVARPRAPARRPTTRSSRRSRPPTATATRPGRRVRGDGPAQRRDPRARLLPALRRQRVRQADLAGALRRAQLARRPARRCSTARSPPPIRPARRSSRSPRWRRSRRASSRRRRRSSTTARSSSARRRSRTPSEPRYGPIEPVAGAQGLLRRLLLHARQRAELARRRSSRRWARKLGLGHTTGHRPPRRDRRPRARPHAGATRGYAEYQKCVKREKCRPRRSRRCRSAAASSGRGRRATTSTSRSARATCRPRRCRWPSPTRRSPTAGASCAPHLGLEVEDGPGARSQEIAHAPPRGTSRSPRPTSATILDGLRRAASEAGGTSADVFTGFGRQAPGLRQDRHRRAAGPARPVLVRRLRARTRAARSSSR